MTTFLERFLQACAHAALKTSGRGFQAAIATHLGIGRQTVNYWVKQGGEPEREMARQIAEKLGVRYEWLAFGKGDMLDAPRSDSLDDTERKIMRAYRSATPDGKRAIAAMAFAARKLLLAITLAFLFVPSQDARASILQFGIYPHLSLANSLKIVYIIFISLRRIILSWAMQRRRALVCLPA
jgi:transcriptional regulator with XRE-family HTH domain